MSKAATPATCGVAMLVPLIVLTLGAIFAGYLFHHSFISEGTGEFWKGSLVFHEHLIHAMHAATGADIPSNEEWHYRPLDVEAPMPWRVMLKWRISTLAGFEGATKIYLNTLTPQSLRDRVVERLFALRNQGRVAPDLKIAFEAPCRPNALRYASGR